MMNFIIKVGRNISLIRAPLKSANSLSTTASRWAASDREIIVEDVNSARVITVNRQVPLILPLNLLIYSRPKALNALNLPMIRSLFEAIKVVWPACQTLSEKHIV
jgi:hypothetical protein